MLPSEICGGSSFFFVLVVVSFLFFSVKGSYLTFVSVLDQNLAHIKFPLHFSAFNLRQFVICKFYSVALFCITCYVGLEL
jgi:hypothetical protein